MSPADVLERTRSFVKENFLYTRPDTELHEQDSLLERGIIDSMGVMELIEFIQSEFDVTIADEEITEANFGSLGAIVRYVVAKRPIEG